MEGWIKTYRSLINHWIWKDSEYLKAWIYLLFRANFSNANVLVDKMLVNVSKGQFITSLKKLSDDTGMSIQRLRTFLKLLEIDQMVKIETSSKLTKITICNYDNYQDAQHTANTLPTHCQHTANTLPTTDKNENNIKKENKEDLLGDKPPKKQKKQFTIPTLEEIQAYCLERQNMVNPTKFLNYYESNGWKVGKNSMKDWKAAVRNWENNDQTPVKNGQQAISTGAGKDYLAGTEKYRKNG